MSSSSKIFFIILILGTIAGFLFYKGFEQESLKRQSIPIPSIEPQIIEEEVLGAIAESVLVTKVVDGDTIEVSIDNTLYKVRLIGVDTPETVHPSQPKGCFGQEASNATKTLLTNKSVILKKDVSESDKYGRLLRYVYLPQEDGTQLFINDYLVREGFAQVLTYPPDVAFNERFLEAQRQAKDNKRGLWGVCSN